MTPVPGALKPGALWWTSSAFSGVYGPYDEADAVLVVLVGEPFSSFDAEWIDALVCQPGLDEAGDVDVLIDAFETSMNSAVAVDVDQRLTLRVEQLGEPVGELARGALQIVYEGMRGGARDRRGPAFAGPDDPRLELRPDEALLATLRTPYLEATDAETEAEIATEADWQPSWAGRLSAGTVQLVDWLVRRGSAPAMPGSHPSFLHALREATRERSISLATALADATQRTGGLAFSPATVRSGGSDEVEILLRVPEHPGDARALAFIEDDQIVIELYDLPPEWEDHALDLALPGAIDEPIQWEGDPGVATSTVHAGHAHFAIGRTDPTALSLSTLVAQVLVLPREPHGEC